MTRPLRRVLLGLLLLAVSVAGAGAESRMLIVREDSAVAQQAADRLAYEAGMVGWEVEVTTPGQISLAARAEGKHALVTLGPQALATVLKQTSGKHIVAAFVAQATHEEVTTILGERGSAILLDQPAERWINLIHLAFPGVQQVGMLAGKSTQKTARALERKMSDRRIGLAIETVAVSEDVVFAIERLVPRMALLLALPDPVVHNRNTVQPLLLTTYRAGIPVVAYSESYQQAGAVLALYSTVPQIVAQIIDTLQLVREGRSLPAVQSPRYYTVGVNTAVARSLGLSLPSAIDLNERLRSMGQ